MLKIERIPYYLKRFLGKLAYNYPHKSISWSLNHNEIIGNYDLTEHFIQFLPYTSIWFC